MPETKKAARPDFIFFSYMAPLAFFILTMVSVLFFPRFTGIFLFLSFGSLLLILVRIISRAFLDKRIRTNRPGRLKESRVDNYFSDMIRDAKASEWKYSEDGKFRLSLSGKERSLPFEITAELLKDGSTFNERITIKFLTNPGESFYLAKEETSGIEKKINIGKDFALVGVRATGSDDLRVLSFLMKQKAVLEFLFREKKYLSELRFENSEMVASLSEGYSSANASIKSVVSKLSELGAAYNQTVATGRS